jgi:hypothetical protein
MFKELRETMFLILKEAYDKNKSINRDSQQANRKFKEQNANSED